MSRSEALQLKVYEAAVELIGTPEEHERIKKMKWHELIDSYIGNGLFLMMLADDRKTPLISKGWGMLQALRDVFGEDGWQKLLDERGPFVFGFDARNEAEIKKQERALRAEAKRLGTPRRFTQ